MRRCDEYGLPYPTFIICTSPNHFHLLWKLHKPLVLNDKKLMGYLERVQRGLYNAFKDLGADQNALDPVRYLRNPYQLNPVNKKYPDRPIIEIEHKGEETSLRELHIPLKGAGLLPPSTDSAPLGGTPLRLSFFKLRKHMTAHTPLESTYKDLALTLGIPERTLYLIVDTLRKRGELETEKIRLGRTWFTRFVFHTALGNNKGGSVGGDSFKRALEVGIKEGHRNQFVFFYSLYQKNALKKSEISILSDLERSFPAFKGGAREFSVGELRAAVRSACRAEYQYAPSWDLLTPMFAAILGHISAPMQSQNPNKDGGVEYAVSKTAERKGGIPAEIKASLALCAARRALGKGFPVVQRPQSEKQALKHLEWVRARRLAYEKGLH